MTNNTFPCCDYGLNTHNAGDVGTFETWDLKSLIEKIADGTITDYNGLCLIPSGTGYPVEKFYDKTHETYKPKLIIKASP